MIKSFSMYSFVAGVMVGALLGAAWFMTDESSRDSDLLVKRAESTNGSFASKSSAISVSTQSAGNGVLVDSVTVPLPGVWIAVRETNGENLGNVLGAARVSGTRTAFSVPLLRDTTAGETYALELYRDDNSGVFDVGFNSVYIDFDTSAPVIVRFKTTDIQQ